MIRSLARPSPQDGVRRFFQAFYKLNSYRFARSNATCRHHHSWPSVRPVNSTSLRAPCLQRFMTIGNDGPKVWKIGRRDRTKNKEPASSYSTTTLPITQALLDFLWANDREGVKRVEAFSKCRLSGSSKRDQNGMILLNIKASRYEQLGVAKEYIAVFAKALAEQQIASPGMDGAPVEFKEPSNPIDHTPNVSSGVSDAARSLYTESQVSTASPAGWASQPLGPAWGIRKLPAQVKQQEPVPESQDSSPETEMGAAPPETLVSSTPQPAAVASAAQPETPVSVPPQSAVEGAAQLETPISSLPQSAVATAAQPKTPISSSPQPAVKGVASARQEASSGYDISESFKQAMRNVPSPVCLVVSLQPSDRTTAYKLRLCGMTVSSLTAVTVSPEPIISFNIKKPSRTLDAIQSSGKFVAHVLGGNDTGATIADAFTKPYELPSKPFHDLDRLHDTKVYAKGYYPHIYGAGVFARLHCNVLPNHEINIGDHVVVMAKVERVTIHTSQGTKTAGLLYAQRSYHSIGDRIHVSGPSAAAQVAAEASQLNPSSRQVLQGAKATGAGVDHTPHGDAVYGGGPSIRSTSNLEHRMESYFDQAQSSTDLDGLKSRLEDLEETVRSLLERPKDEHRVLPVAKAESSDMLQDAGAASKSDVQAKTPPEREDSQVDLTSGDPILDRASTGSGRSLADAVPFASPSAFQSIQKRQYSTYNPTSSLEATSNAREPGQDDIFEPEEHEKKDPLKMTVGEMFAHHDEPLPRKMNIRLMIKELEEAGPERIREAVAEPEDGVVRQKHKRIRKVLVRLNNSIRQGHVEEEILPRLLLGPGSGYETAPKDEGEAADHDDAFKGGI